MNLKQEHYIFGMIGLAALAVLYYLYMESQAASANATNPDGISGAAVVPSTGSSQQYPSIPETKLGDVTINNQAGPQLLYNSPMDGALLPDVRIGAAPGAGDCGCDDCEPAGQPVSVQVIPEKVYSSAVSNLLSFHAKVGSA